MAQTVRVRLWFILLIFAGVIVVGLISLPFRLFFSWDDIFGDGGIADWFLNVFSYGLLYVLIILPVGLLGATLIWQPREARERYRLWKLGVGLALAAFAVMLARGTFTDETPFTTTRADAARRAAERH